jgi:hypothetical protein
MSAQQLAEKLGDVTGRRRALTKIAATGIGSALYLIGIRSVTAEATCFQHGCALCDSCTQPCPPTYLLEGCAWCWLGNCHRNPGGSSWHRTWCCEGHKAPSHCDGVCDSSWVCSFFDGNVCVLRVSA